MVPAFHLVCGSTGAGKTTYALALTQHLKGVHFSIDEWMVGLFGKDQPKVLQFTWVMERVERCEQQIARVATQCARAGIRAGARSILSPRARPRQICRDRRAGGVLRRAASA